MPGDLKNPALSSDLLFQFINRASFLPVLSAVYPTCGITDFGYGEYTLFYRFCLRFCDGVFSGVTFGDRRFREYGIQRSEM